MSAAQPWRQQTARQIRDAAFNAVAVASLAYQREVMALTAILTAARTHGLTVADLVAASGLDEPFITRLLDEGAAD